MYVYIYMYIYNINAIDTYRLNIKYYKVLKYVAAIPVSHSTCFRLGDLSASATEIQLSLLVACCPERIREVSRSFKKFKDLNT